MNWKEILQLNWDMQMQRYFEFLLRDSRFLNAIKTIVLARDVTNLQNQTNKKDLYVNEWDVMVK